jgi:RNA-directed DNA polymerase
LSIKGYKAKPLKRKSIPKKNGKLRHLGIPTIRDRAIQALFKLGLEPIAETTADLNSYGFCTRANIRYFRQEVYP